MDELATFFAQLQSLIEQQKFEDLESDTIELKPCPATGQNWAERYKSVNAFLNTRGGILILGVKEEGQGIDRRYVVTGYDSAAENPLKEVRYAFTSGENIKFDASEYLSPPEIRNFMGKRVAILRVDELPADKRFLFFNKTAYKRQLTGDEKVKQAEIDAYSEYLEEVAQAKELDVLADANVDSIDLDRLNEYILQLNKLQKIESLKPTKEAAVPFLVRKRFLIDDKLTLLGGLVCGAYPGDLLGFKSHIHGYVNPSNQNTLIVQDKQDMLANVLQLLEQANAYVLRNIQLGIASQLGGTLSAQYPEAVIRETINNAVAHRDYSINKQIVISITPGQKIEISNPGKFRSQLLMNLESTYSGQMPILRVVPETKPRNPRLADVLRVYRKWEGRGIGMSTLVNLSLDNRLNLPYFKFKSDEVTLVLQAGQLIDDRIVEIFNSRDAYITKKLGSLEDFSKEKQAVLAYLIKSEWANSEGRYCVLLTSDNNHSKAIRTLVAANLISRDTRSSELYPVYTVDRNLVSEDFEDELRQRFGSSIDELELLWRKVLTVVYRYNTFSSKRGVTAKQAGYALWTTESGDMANVKAFDHFARNIRRVFNKLEEQGYIVRDTQQGGKGFVLGSTAPGTQRSFAFNAQ